MSKTTLTKTGLVKQTLLDENWTDGLEEGFQNLEDRTGRSGSGPPGTLQGNWYGQTYYDTAGGEFWECVLPGTSSTNGWIKKASVPVGQVGLFFRSSAPLGWIRFGATYNKNLYPGLVAVLPPGIVTTSTTFTLPNMDLHAMWFRDITLPNELTFGQIGQVNNATDITPVVGDTYQVLNVLMAVKY